MNIGTREIVLIYLLKLDILSSTIDIDSYGDLNLEWYENKHNLIRLSIDEKGKIYYYILINGEVIAGDDIIALNNLAC